MAYKTPFSQSYGFSSSHVWMWELDHKESWTWKSLGRVWFFTIPWTIQSHGILQTITLEWVAIPFSRGSYQPGNQTQIPNITGGLFNIWASCCCCAAAKSLQSCLTQCDPIDVSPPGSPVPGILQERTLEWVLSQQGSPKKAECQRIDAFELWCWRRLQSPLDFKEIKPVNPKGNQLWIFFGRTDDEAEAPILWPPDEKNRLNGKDPNAGKDWMQDEKGMTGDEMVGWHHGLDGHEFE